MFTNEQIEAIVNDITFCDPSGQEWKVRVRYEVIPIPELQKIAEEQFNYKGRPYIQVFGHSLNPKTDDKEDWSSRKWMLSPHMCKNEIIRTAYKAVECAVAHETNEMFLYKGMPVFTPHMDYDKVIEMMEEGHFIDARDNGMQGV